ncbi:MAG: hypothetical protein K2J36_11235 [Ruminococcus sp.]|nr:hypothetical protein [Ruminococcus sp.]
MLSGIKRDIYNTDTEQVIKSYNEREIFLSDLTYSSTTTPHFRNINSEAVTPSVPAYCYQE